MPLHYGIRTGGDTCEQWYGTTDTWKEAKVKGPLSARPQVLLFALQHKLDTTSDNPEEKREKERERERVVGQEPKRLRSTFFNPRSDSAKEWAVGTRIGPVISPSERHTEKTDQERKSGVDKPLPGSVQFFWC